MNNEIRYYLRVSVVMLFLAILQVVLGSLIEINGVIPGFLLIGIVFLSQMRGQLVAMLYGFPVGVLVDLYAGELAGLTALALVVAGFAAGFFYDEEKHDRIIRSPRMVVTLAVSAALYHSVYAFAYIRSLQTDILPLMATQIIGGSFYTLLFGSIYILILSRIDKKINMEYR